MACSSSKEGQADVVDYYFEIRFDATSQIVREDIPHIIRELPAYIYYISRSSGQAWPFYQKAKPSEFIHRDSLMTPHIFAHRMLPSEKVSSGDTRQRKVLIDYGVDEFDQPQVEIVLQAYRGGQWMDAVHTGAHIIQKDKYKNPNERWLLVYQTIVRYSFK